MSSRSRASEKAMEAEFAYLWNQNLHRLKHRDPAVAQQASKEMASHLKKWCTNARNKNRKCEQVMLTALADLTFLVRTTTKGIDGDLARQYTGGLIDRARKESEMVNVD